MLKYGSYKSENRVNKYFSIVIERNDCVVRTGAIVYPHSVHLSDVTIHTFCDDETTKCKYSPTGYCNNHEEIGYSSLDVSLSPEIVSKILLERIQKVIPLLAWEIEEISNMYLNEKTFVEGE